MVSKLNFFSRVFGKLSFLFLVIAISCSTPSILVTQEQYAGDNSFNQHNYPEAIQHYKKMLEASSRLGIYRNFSMEADVYRKIANSYEMMGQYPIAIDNVHLALQLDSIEANTLNEIENYRLLGKMYLYAGDNQSGIFFLKKSLSLSDGMEQSVKNVHRLSIADTYLALGQSYAVIGHFKEAIHHSQIGLDLYQKANNEPGQMESLLILSSISIDLGDMDLAKQQVGESIKIANSLQMSTARHHRNLSEIYSTLGYYEDALRYQEDALDQAREYAILPQQIWFTICMGDIYRDLGDAKLAREYYTQASELTDTMRVQAKNIQASLDLRLGELLRARDYFISGGSVEGAGISLLRLGELAFLDEDYDSALDLFTQAEAFFIRAGSLIGQSSSHLNLGKIHLEKEEFFKSLQYLDSLVILEEFPEIAWQAWFHKGRIFEKQENFIEAKSAYTNSIRIIESIRGNLTIDEFKSVYMHNKREVYDRFINVALEMDDFLEAFNYSERAKARAFYEMIANKKINFRETEDTDLTLQEQEKRFEIQKAYKQLQNIHQDFSVSNDLRSGNKRSIQQSLINLQEDYQEIIRKLKLFNPAYAEIVETAPFPLSEVQTVLDKKTAIITYWLSEGLVHIWLIGKNEMVHISKATLNVSMDDFVEETRRFIESNSIEKAQVNLSILYSLLLEPLKNKLNSYQNLVFIPNGSLHFLPFHALRTKDGIYLIEKFNVSYAPSASVYKLCREMEISEGNRFFGAALSDIAIGNNPGLPGTKNELDKIIPLFPDHYSLYGENSTESAVKVSLSDYDYLHLATHGFYNFNQPVYSYLLFPSSKEDDGRLTVHEVFEMNLNARLVSLSACETGLGHLDKGDELVGLSRAFIYAGSPSVLVSLWSVADYPTALLMSKFYMYMKDYSIQEALSLAQREVMKDFPSPIYWAPFILIGNGAY